MSDDAEVLLRQVQLERLEDHVLDWFKRNAADLDGAEQNRVLALAVASFPPNPAGMPDLDGAFLLWSERWDTPEKLREAYARDEIDLPTFEARLDRCLR